MTENSTALLFDILDTATQGDPDSASNNIALLNQLLTATDNDPSNISANETALLTEILSIITDQPPDVAANEIAVLTEILAAIQSQNPQVRANKIALLNEIAANSGSLSDVLNIVAPSDLVAWYPFRQGTGVDATAGIDAFGDSTDYSATVNGATFKPSGGVTDIQTGANSGAFDFDGTDDTMDVGEPVVDTPFTVMAFVKTDLTTNKFRMIVGQDDFNEVDTSIDAYSIIDSKDGDIRFQTNTGDAFVNRDVAAPSGFVHTAMTHDGAEVVGFINGSEAIRFDDAGNINSSFPLRMGRNAGGGDSRFDFLSGILDSVRVYNTALSGSQINQIYLNTEP